MSALPREQIDAAVRAVEAEAYGYALGAVQSPAEAERIVLDAFGAEARSFSTPPRDLEPRLRRRIASLLVRRRSRPVRGLAVPNLTGDARRSVPAALHVHLVDRVEESQYVESTGTRKAVLLSALGAGIIAALIAIQWLRLDALASAQPSIHESSPAANAVGVPTRGDFSITFGRPPMGTPHLRLEPADGSIGSVSWNGTRLIVPYLGLHNARRYQLVIAAPYESRLGETGHFEARWSFITDDFPAVVSVEPSDGGAVVARNGEIAVNFNHQGNAEPRLFIDPPDATTEPGYWNGATWTVPYTGLKPATRYRVTLSVDYGAPRPSTRRSWTFETEPGVPPAGLQVLWFSRNDPRNFGHPPRMLALDWKGRLAGSMYAPVTEESPDGSIVGTENDIYLDRAGNRLGALSGLQYFPLIADDDRSVCELSSTVNGRIMDKLWLMTGPASGPLRAVAPVASFDHPPELGLIACSVLNDRAVIVYDAGSGPTAVKVFSLSTGRVVYQHAYTTAVANLISARDGRFLAELMPVHGSLGMPAMTLIRRTADGAVVARLDNEVGVRFSWDDQRLVATTPYRPEVPNVITLLTWETGRVLWTVAASAGQPQPVVAWSEPNGGKMAVATSTDASLPLDRLWLVDAEGQASLVLSDLFYPASVTGF